VQTIETSAKAVFAWIRHRPGRALAISVPLLAVAVLTGPAVASPHPEATLAVTRAEQNAAPAPLVRTFAESPTGQQMKTYKHAHRVPIAWNVDGCDHDYGTPNVCVPWKIPASSGQAACDWLRANGFGRLRVYGTNRQHLPENSHGYVCAEASR
jgi:hypothetical protein